MSQFRVRFASHSNPGRDLDGPQPKKQRAKRPGQQPPVNVTGQPKERSEREDGEWHGSSSFTSWGERKQRQADAWSNRWDTDVDCFIATAPEQQTRLAARQAAVLQHRQEQLDALKPLPCRVAGSDGSCCDFEQTGTQTMAFYGVLGTAGHLVVPVFKCRAHGCEGVTVHPFQIDCVPTAPVNNSKLMDMDLVEEFLCLQLKDGVSGHGTLPQQAPLRIYA